MYYFQSINLLVNFIWKIKLLQSLSQRLLDPESFNVINIIYSNALYIDGSIIVRDICY